MFTVRATHSSKAFLQISTLEKGFHRTLDDRAPEAVLALKPFIVDLTGKKSKCSSIKHHSLDARGSSTIAPLWCPLVQYGQFGTRSNHEENALSGSQVGNRKARSPSIPSMVDRPMATAWKYTRQIVYART